MLYNEKSKCIVPRFILAYSISSQKLGFYIKTILIKSKNSSFLNVKTSNGKQIIYEEQGTHLKESSQKLSLKTKINPEYAVSYDNEDNFLSDDRGDEFEQVISGSGEFSESESGISGSG